MYNHGDNEDDVEVIVEHDETENNKDDENCDTEVDDVDYRERTFLNPSQSVDEPVNEPIDEQVDGHVDENVDKLVKEPVNFKCELCIFQITNKTRLDRHTFENHSVKGKYICIQCKQEFDTRKKFNSHNYHGCSSFSTNLI
jgi:hypothetical protein